jgi:hypothetical protein
VYYGDNSLPVGGNTITWQASSDPGYQVIIEPPLVGGTGSDELYMPFVHR